MNKKVTKFSPEVRERAVRLVREQRSEHPSMWAAVESIAPMIGCTPQTLHEWVKRDQVDHGERDGGLPKDAETLRPSMQACPYELSTKSVDNAVDNGRPSPLRGGKVGICFRRAMRHRVCGPRTAAQTSFRRDPLTTGRRFLDGQATSLGGLGQFATQKLAADTLVLYVAPRTDHRCRTAQGGSSRMDTRATNVFPVLSLDSLTNQTPNALCRSWNMNTDAENRENGEYRCAQRLSAT